MRTEKLGALLELLSRTTGKRFDATSFDSRLRIQKTVYLLKMFNYTPVKAYSYSRYFHGPYCPDLARDYYALHEGKVKAAEEVLTLPVKALLGVGKAVRKGNPFLEAVTTLHMVSTANRASKKAASETVLEMKPHLDKAVVEEAWQFLEDYDLVGARTSTPAS